MMDIAGKLFCTPRQRYVCRVCRAARLSRVSWRQCENSVSKDC